MTKDVSFGKERNIFEVIEEKHVTDARIRDVHERAASFHKRTGRPYARRGELEEVWPGFNPKVMSKDDSRKRLKRAERLEGKKRVYPLNFLIREATDNIMKNRVVTVISRDEAVAILTTPEEDGGLGLAVEYHDHGKKRMELRWTKEADIVESDCYEAPSEYDDMEIGGTCPELLALLGLEDDEMKPSGEVLKPLAGKVISEDLLVEMVYGFRKWQDICNSRRVEEDAKKYGVITAEVQDTPAPVEIEGASTQEVAFKPVEKEQPEQEEENPIYDLNDTEDRHRAFSEEGITELDKELCKCSADMNPDAWCGDEQRPWLR